VKSGRLRALVLSLSCLLLGIAMPPLHLGDMTLFPAFWATPLLGALYFFFQYGREGMEWRQLSLQCDYFERGLARVAGAWIGKGRSGEEFARGHHLYRDDLNILGTGSLFELLCTTRTSAGAERLASYLLDACEPTETKLRQEAVRELVDPTVLREQAACLGKYVLQDCDREHQHNFESWLDAWAEFEALQALATYAYERPDGTFPEFVEGPSLVEAEQLGHPLLEDDMCVCNDGPRSPSEFELSGFRSNGVIGPNSSVL
jgi:hypothetical protein